ncbi:MAG: molybdenum cofactor guanylyltransferase [Pseudomonadota bacterium]
MKVLGAIIAGGLSTRFGSDKALAMIEGRTMIDYAIDALRPQVESVVLCGRELPGIATIRDRPAHRIGPLGGLNAALQYADRCDFDAVLCIPVDVWPLPTDTRERLAGANPAVFDQQHLIGFWPARLASMLDQHIACGEHSVRSWIVASHAGVVSQPAGLSNINEQRDLLRTLK